MPGLTAEEFRDVIGRFATGVTVITTREDGEPRGTTASAVSSLSLEPPMLLICLNESSATGQAVARTGTFAVNVLAEGQEAWALRFATRGGAKFAGVASHDGADGAPLLDAALATLECRVVERVRGGTHVVFLAAVERARAGAGAPLAYFRGRFGRLDPAGADGATAALRERVIARSLPIGAPLELDALAVELAVPRSHVFEALTRLAEQRLVRRGADGFTVEPLTLPAVEDALRAHCAIECGAAALGVGQGGDELLTLAARLGEQAAGGDRDAWVRAAVAFFERLVALGGSAELASAYRRVNASAMITSLRARATADVELPPTSQSVHGEIAEAWCRGDLAAVVAGLRRWMVATTEVAGRYLAAAGGAA